ncbi:hypothetical protein GGF31_007971 [Allomyces arbusculus]|nr:hypothetical protein GGF31_007971 [Allomyces arbusculus]
MPALYPSPSDPTAVATAFPPLPARRYDSARALNDDQSKPSQVVDADRRMHGAVALPDPTTDHDTNPPRWSSRPARTFSTPPALPHSRGASSATSPALDDFEQDRVARHAAYLADQIVAVYTDMQLAPLHLDADAQAHVAMALAHALMDDCGVAFVMSNSLLIRTWVDALDPDLYHPFLDVTLRVVLDVVGVLRVAAKEEQVNEYGDRVAVVEPTADHDDHDGEPSTVSSPSTSATAVLATLLAAVARLLTSRTAFHIALRILHDAMHLPCFTHLTVALKERLLAALLYWNPLRPHIDPPFTSSNTYVAPNGCSLVGLDPPTAYDQLILVILALRSHIGWPELEPDCLFLAPSILVDHIAHKGIDNHVLFLLSWDAAVQARTLAILIDRGPTALSTRIVKWAAAVGVHSDDDDVRDRAQQLLLAICAHVPPRVDWIEYCVRAQVPAAVLTQLLTDALPDGTQHDVPVLVCALRALHLPDHAVRAVAARQIATRAMVRDDGALVEAFVDIDLNSPATEELDGMGAHVAQLLADWDVTVRDARQLNALSILARVPRHARAMADRVPDLVRALLDTNDVDRAAPIVQILAHVARHAPNAAARAAVFTRDVLAHCVHFLVTTIDARIRTAVAQLVPPNPPNPTTDADMHGHLGTSGLDDADGVIDLYATTRIAPALEGANFASHDEVTRHVHWLRLVAVAPRTHAVVAERGMEVGLARFVHVQAVSDDDLDVQVLVLRYLAALDLPRDLAKRRDTVLAEAIESALAPVAMDHWAAARPLVEAVLHVLPQLHGNLDFPPGSATTELLQWAARDPTLAPVVLRVAIAHTHLIGRAWITRTATHILASTSSTAMWTRTARTAAAVLLAAPPRTETFDPDAWLVDGTLDWVGRVMHVHAESGWRLTAMLARADALVGDVKAAMPDVLNAAVDAVGGSSGGDGSWWFLSAVCDRQGVPAGVWARVDEIIGAATRAMVVEGLTVRVAAARVVAAAAREDVAVLVPYDTLVVAMMRSAAVGAAGGEHARAAVRDLQASTAAVVTRLLERDVNRVDKWGSTVAEFLAACVEVGEEVAHLACVVAGVRPDVVDRAVHEHGVDWARTAAGKVGESRTMVQLLAHVMSIWGRDGEVPGTADAAAIARVVTARAETTTDLTERDVLYYTLASLVRLSPTQVETARVARVVVAHLAPPPTSATAPPPPSAHLVRLLAAVAAAPDNASALRTPAVARWIRHAIRHPPPPGTTDPLPSVLVQIVRTDTDASAFLVSRTTTTVGGDRLTLIEALVGTCITHPRPALVTCVTYAARFASVGRALFARPRPWIAELVRAVDAAGRAVARGGGGGGGMGKEVLGMLLDVVEVWTACSDVAQQMTPHLPVFIDILRLTWLPPHTTATLLRTFRTMCVRTRANKLAVATADVVLPLVLALAPDANPDVTCAALEVVWVLAFQNRETKVARRRKEIGAWVARVPRERDGWEMVEEVVGKVESVVRLFLGGGGGRG